MSKKRESLLHRVDPATQPDPNCEYAVDVENGLFEIFNRNYFTDLKPYTVKYWVERDGKRPFWWFKRKKHFSTAPQTAEQFQIRLPKMKKPGNYRIFFEVSAAQDMPLVDKNTILACDEILLKSAPAPRKERVAKGNLETPRWWSAVPIWNWCSTRPMALSKPGK